MVRTNFLLPYALGCLGHKNQPQGLVIPGYLHRLVTVRTAWYLSQLPHRCPRVAGRFISTFPGSPSTAVNLVGQSGIRGALLSRACN